MVEEIGLEGAVVLLLVALVGLALFYGVARLLCWLFSAPMRRHERARLLLELMEIGLERGQSPEHLLQEDAVRRERVLKRPLRRQARRLESGVRLGDALRGVPELLPPAAVALIEAGERLGNLRAAIPACRRLLRDGVEQVSRAHHYLVLLLLVTTPAWLGMTGVLYFYVLPIFLGVVEELGLESSGLVVELLKWRVPVLALQLGLLLVLWTGAALYCGGPRLTRWLTRRLPRAWEGWRAALPWNRRRVMRDFALLLAVAVDVGLPEAQAVALAGDGAGDEGSGCARTPPGGTSNRAWPCRRPWPVWTTRASSAGGWPTRGSAAAGSRPRFPDGSRRSMPGRFGTSNWPRRR